MDIFKANKIGLELMDKHGLTALGWKFQMDNAKRRFGVCKHRSKLISISLALTQLNPEEQVTDTILHEIAHALVGPKHGHDYVWKAKAIEIGCKPERCYGEEVVRPKGNYTAICPNPKCGHVHTRLKKQKKGRKTSCAVCTKGFSLSVLLVFEPVK